MNIASSATDPLALAFYYPQFHQSPLNDKLYGPGFTEWDNVNRGKPLFPGHQQPRRPGPPILEYDLDEPAVYPTQVELARKAGISGFCFYHYWMTGGRRILERPFEAVLAGDEDFPFCLMWTNHDWTMAWRGEPNELTLEMTYAAQDPADFIDDIADALNDPRYIRIDGRPLLSIYEIDGPPDLSKLIQSLRHATQDLGIGDLFVAGVQSRLHSPNRLCPDLDALLEFPPHGYRDDAATAAPANADRVDAAQFFDYRNMVAASLLGTNLVPGVPYFRAATPDWDNTARRMDNRNPAIFLESTPERFGTWMQGLLAEAATSDTSLPIVFVNAWNEWGESAYLEPDTQGSQYADALAVAVRQWPSARAAADVARELLAHDSEQLQALLPPPRSVPVEVFDLPTGPGATLWLDRLQNATAPFDASIPVYRGIADIRGFVVNPAVKTDLMKTPRHHVYLVGHQVTYRVELPAVARNDLLSKHENWLSAENISGAGFRGAIDFTDVVPGTYELHAPLGAHVGIAKSTLCVLEATAEQAGSAANAHAGPKAPRTLFEPAMSYTASVRSGSAHELVARALDTRQAERVLDCGCADGSFGAYLIERGLDVHGLEFDRTALAIARERLSSAQAADFELTTWTERAEGPFDALLFIDVLEHIRRPDLVVAQARRLLARNGAIIASIPNIAHLTRRLALLQGDWTYEDWGLLDRTHLRFFTLASVTKLFEEAGYAIEHVAHTVAPTGLVSDIPSEITEFLREKLTSVDAVAYQYVITAVPLA